VENHLPPIPVDHGRLSITPSLHRPRGPAFPRRPPRPLRPRRPATSLLSAPARRLPRPGRSSFGPTVRWSEALLTAAGHPSSLRCLSRPPPRGRRAHRV